MYFFANNLEDPTTANLVISEIQRLCGSPTNRPPGVRMVDIAFDQTIHGDGLRNLLVDFYIYGSRTPEGFFPHEFDELFMERFFVAKSNRWIGVGETFRQEHE
jgi:hypothetical protein